MNCKDLRIMLTLSLSTEKQEARRKQRDSQNSEKKSLNLELYKQPNYHSRLSGGRGVRKVYHLQTYSEINNKRG